MSNAIFPSNIKGLTWTVAKNFRGSTIKQSAPNLAQVRIAQTLNPFWEWSLVYDYLYDLNTAFVSPNNTMPNAPWSDVETLIGFLLARQTDFDDFLFTDPSIPTPCSIGPGTISGSPNPRATLQLITPDGLNYYSPIQKLWGGQFYEDVTDLNGAITVYANGSVTSAYTVMGPGLTLPGYSFQGLYLKWSMIPTQPITAAFNFYYRVHLASDSQDFEEFMAGLYTIGGGGAKRGSGELKLETSRPPNV